MAGLELKIEAKGFEEMARTFGKASDIIKDQFQKAINAALPELQTEVRRKTPVITGRLRGGIEHVPARLDELTGFVRSTVVYGPFVHERKPFMEWGLESGERKVMARFEQATKNIKELLTK